MIQGNRPIVGVVSDRRMQGEHPFHMVGEKYLQAIADSRLAGAPCRRSLAAPSSAGSTSRVALADPARPSRSSSTPTRTTTSRRSVVAR